MRSGSSAGRFARTCRYGEVSHTFLGGSGSRLFDIGNVGGAGGSRGPGAGSGIDKGPGVDEGTGIDIGVGACAGEEEADGMDICGGYGVRPGPEVGACPGGISGVR